MGETTGLAPQQRRTLARLKPLIDHYQLYLAGGGAVALHVGHRQSLDIDLFSRGLDLDLATFRDDTIAVLDDATTLGMSDATLRLEITGTLVDVVRYPYDLLESSLPGPEGVPIAGIRDLSAMKLAAVAQRGIRRDFWDLFELLQHGLTLSIALDSYMARYGASHSDLYHVMRALSYFEDAEQDKVMPKGLNNAKWQVIRTFFEQAATLELKTRLDRK